eukprot:399171-Amphidinium_carterae.1
MGQRCVRERDIENDSGRRIAALPSLPDKCCNICALHPQLPDKVSNLQASPTYHLPRAWLKVGTLRCSPKYV